MSSTVLVTGGSGYIASFIIAQLLNEGFEVRTTVRNLAREGEVRTAVGKISTAGDRLRFFAADLNADKGWREAATGCDAVLHVASPLPTSLPQNDEDLIRPARDGALRVLIAARDAGVKRVVMTSSTAAITYGYGSRSKPYTEADWSDVTNLADTSGYERSKIIAERAAWDWLAREGGALELVTICPAAVIGPVLGHDSSASIGIVKRLLDGSIPGVPHVGYPLVDVRDIADLHLRAMRTPAAAGQRYIGGGPFYWMSDIARVLRERTPELANKVPTRALPSWIIRIRAIFSPAIRSRAFELDKERHVSADKAKRELGWLPRSNDEAIVATVRSLFAEGVLAK